MHRQSTAAYLSGYIQVKFFRLLPTIVILLFVTGCQSIPDSGTPAPVTENRTPPRSETTYSSSEQPVPQHNTTVVALSETAHRQAAVGDIARARSTLERALRIDPRNASLWNELAHLYYRDEMFNKAANTAAKSNSLAGSDSNLRYDNWRLIARAREKTGDKNGARIAEENALRYR